MRILTLATRYSVGGAQMNSLLIADGLRRLGHDTEAWFLMRAGSMDVPEGLSTRILIEKESRNPLLSIGMALRLIKQARASKPDVIIGFHPLANVMGALVSFFCPHIRFVATQRNPSSSQGALIGVIEHLLGGTRLYSANIAVTNAVLDTYRSYSNRYRRRMLVIHNGAPPLPQTSEDGASFRARHGLPAGPALGVLGRLAEQKNPLFVLDVLRRLQTCHVFFAGSGPLEKEIRMKANALGLSSRIHLLGELHGPDVTGFYKCIDLFLLPSLFEGFGRTLVEAMQSGLPVVANRIPVTEEVVGSAGILEALDAQAWANAIESLMASPCRRDELSALSVERARRFSLDSMIAGYERAATAAIAKVD